VIGHEAQRLKIDGIAEAWCQPEQPESGEQQKLVYRASILVDFRVNFRSLRAGLNHSEERSYTAWIPPAGLAIDWDRPSAIIRQPPQISHLPNPDLDYLTLDYGTTAADIDQYQAELIDTLVRNERLKVFFNPVFGFFSAPGDSIETFLPRVAEAALTRVEPELKRLRSRFELQLEQIREAHTQKGVPAEDINTEGFISRRLHFFASESRLADLFSTLAGSVFGTTEAKRVEVEYQPDEEELREDLERVEQEASEALRLLYDEYLALANEHDVFEIGLQPDNIQVIRRMLLWVPVADEEQPG
jgi:hypothetical protein